MIVDVYSRKIVGWEIYSSENSDNAADLFQKAYLREGISGDDLTLHSDNGSPMKGAALLMTLKMLSVSASFSRPGVSNDNPYSEALFKTLKYQPLYPQKPFDNIEEARQWVADFVEYNMEWKSYSARAAHLIMLARKNKARFSSAWLLPPERKSWLLKLNKKKRQLP